MRIFGENQSSLVAQVPTGHVSVSPGEAVPTDRLIVDHDVALVRIPTSHQADGVVTFSP